MSFPVFPILFLSFFSLLAFDFFPAPFLNIDSNFITSVPSGIFDHLTYLASLSHTIIVFSHFKFFSMNNNYLVTLPPGLFSSQSKLTNLFHPFPFFINSPPRHILFIQTLSHLFLLMFSMDSVDSLICSFHFHNPLFHHSFLDLHSNIISFLPSNIFNKLNSLINLNLKFNLCFTLSWQLNYIPIPLHPFLLVFSMDSIVFPVFCSHSIIFSFNLSFCLHSNKLISIHSDAFNDVTLLKFLIQSFFIFFFHFTIYLSSNSLESLHQSTFSNLKSLTFFSFLFLHSFHSSFIDLNSNKFTSLPPNIFDNNDKLRYLYVSIIIHNHIQILLFSPQQ